MTPEQIREAVELAGGWGVRHDGICEYFTGPPPFMDWHPDSCSPQELRIYLAALASQLISQVDAMDNIHVSTLPRASEVWENIVVSDHDGARCLAHHEGPNRDENSILACTELLKARK